MADILHRIGIKSSSPEDVYAALTTLEGLPGWWERDTTGETALGGVIAFRFVPGGFDMKVAELVPGKKVLWEVALAGLALLAFAGARAEAWFTLAVALVPLGDTLIVLRHGGTRATAFGIHFTTAVLVLLSATLLFAS
jgi:uncharacterized protein YndB with AHSA1/START domain